MSMIPVNNKPALIGYYVGFAALIPLCGCAFSIPAIILGVIGLIQAGKINGEGKVHAIVAIVLGVGTMVVYGPLLLIIIATSASK